MASGDIYKIKLPQFEGPFDLLLFFIERDELDIYNIPITKIINDFLSYIHSQDNVNFFDREGLIGNSIKSMADFFCTFFVVGDDQNVVHIVKI